ncbi:MAG TPA: hypothetical protein VGY66_22860 [Gemmataceae bacterium]|nr:hypothetical protein [Gemmataceae bacterium]
MSSTQTNGVCEQADAASKKKSRRRHTPGGICLGKDASREARQMTAAILDVLAGARTPAQAAEVLGISLPRYFQLETQAMHALVKSCEPKPRGPGRNVDRELAALRQQCDRLQRELVRQQTLVRMAQRTIGLAPPAALPKPAPGKKRRRRPVVRALAAAGYLQQQSQDAPVAVTEAENSDKPE